MAVSNTVLKHATECLRATDGPKRVASFGYPDIMSTAVELAALVPGKTLAYRKDSAAICRRHSMDEQPVADSASFFGALGAELVVFDLTAERGGEIITNLNYPMTPQGTFCLVLDPGTLEHCFNIAQAAFNMASLVQQGGFVLHDNPMVAGNHGFYGMNPTWYYDFYTQNGFKLEAFAVYGHQVGASPKLTERFLMPYYEHHIIALAKRTTVQELTYPIQTKYRRIT